jgi:hypothetical protein
MITLCIYLHIGMVYGSDRLGRGWWDIKAVKKRYNEGSMTSEKGLLSCMVTESMREFVNNTTEM